jgi:hypothetical protein
MKVFRPRQAAATIALCWLIMGQSPHCHQEDFVKYQFDLEGCPDDAFRMPESVVRGAYKLHSTNRQPSLPCPGFQLYDFVEHKKGFANPDLIYPDVYVRLERGESCRLNIVVVAIPERHSEPTMRAETIAQLVMQGSTAQPRLSAAMREHIGNGDDLEYWCARQRARAQRSMAAAGSRTCMPDPLSLVFSSAAGDSALH